MGNTQNVQKVTDDARVIIFAHGVFCGGGWTLIEAIFSWVEDNDCILILDTRAQEKVPDKLYCKTRFFESGFCGRLKAEHYAANLRNKCQIISFNSIPFILPVFSGYTVFFQNVNLLEQNFKAGFVQLIKSIIFKLLATKDINFIAQSETVAKALQKVLGRKSGEKVTIRPFVNLKWLELFSLPQDKKVNESFIYIANGLPHKNHANLISAWRTLASEYDLRPHLYLTLEQGAKTLDAVERVNRQLATNIHNLGVIDQEQLFHKMNACQALIYPSLQESFGLPLIEAKVLGLDVLASELDYVWEVCEPTITFDPYSSSSIARNVASYLGANVNNVQVVNGNEFMTYLTEEIK